MTTRIRSHTSSLWLCGLATLFIGATTAHAFEGPPLALEPGTSIKLKYSSLDLLTDKGTEQLYKRIQRAARQVCFQDVSSSDPRYLYHRRKCELAAVEKAVGDINNNKLTAMYRGKRGLPPVG